MTMLKVLLTAAQRDSLRARIKNAGLPVEFREADGILILILNNLSHAHTLREVLDSEGVRVLYDADW